MDPAPPVIPNISQPEPLAHWERELLRKARLLRQARKSVILLLEPNGAIRVWGGEPAGILPPP